MFETLEAISEKLKDQLRTFSQNDHDSDLFLFAPIEETSNELASEIARLKSNPVEIGKDALRAMQENDPEADKPGEYTFPFEETADPRKGRPYVAILSVKDGKLDRSFFDFDQTYGRKEGYCFRRIHTPSRTGCRDSDRRIVEEQVSLLAYLSGRRRGLKELGHYQDSRLKMNLTKYLSGKIDIETLIK